MKTPASEEVEQDQEENVEPPTEELEQLKIDDESNSNMNGNTHTDTENAISGAAIDGISKELVTKHPLQYR